jgi:hypothetical protein
MFSFDIIVADLINASVVFIDNDDQRDEGSYGISPVKQFFYTVGVMGPYGIENRKSHFPRRFLHGLSSGWDEM